jgi:YegS/Rv2252/BmrU family lipid kinase
MPRGADEVRRPRRVLVVANPAAGLRRGHSAGESAASAARKAGAQVDLHVTREPGDATRRASAAEGEGYDLVIAAGGDGTAHEAANGLAGTGVPLAVAPAGTMNLLARVLGVPLDPAEAAARAVEGFAAFPVRPGDAAGRLFLLMAGAGFDAWVLRELLREARGKIRFRDYVRGALRGLRNFPFPRMTMVAHGEAVPAHTVIAGRAPLYGGFLRPTPHVRLNDDTLEVCSLSGGPRELATIVPRLWSGAHAGCRGVALARSAGLTIDAAEGDVPYQLDGELAGTLPVAIRISERAVVLAAPARR